MTEQPDLEELIVNAPGGSIFEFKDLEKAKAFAAAVKLKFNLDGRVFTDAKAAARSHAFPWEQYPPVVHIDRPWWGISVDDKEAWAQAWAIEPKIEIMAKKFGGVWIGT